MNTIGRSIWVGATRNTIGRSIWIGNTTISERARDMWDVYFYKTSSYVECKWLVYKVVLL
jgi:hypothetical protein